MGQVDRVIFASEQYESDHWNQTRLHWSKSLWLYCLRKKIHAWYNFLSRQTCMRFCLSCFLSLSLPPSLSVCLSVSLSLTHTHTPYMQTHTNIQHNQSCQQLTMPDIEQNTSKSLITVSKIHSILQGYLTETIAVVFIFISGVIMQEHLDREICASFTTQNHYHYQYYHWHRQLYNTDTN